MGLSYPYSIPAHRFQALFYRDTYFINLGLIELNQVELAKNNTDNILYIVDKYGFMPNASRFGMINRSHPPFLSKMVKDVYRVIQDDEWLKNAYNSRFLEDGQNYCAIDLNHCFPVLRKI